MIGKYERGEAAPSIDAAKKIADALEVSLDNLVGESAFKAFDKKHCNALKTWNIWKRIRKNALRFN